MAGGRRRGGYKAAAKRQLKLGDLVLAKVKGFPAWPAKVSRPEDWKHIPDPKKIFVYFFGTEEIGFIAPTDIQVFTSETKSKLVARCEGKSKLVKCFARAVEEICDAFDELQSSQSSRLRDGTDELQKSIDCSEDYGVENDENVVSDRVGVCKETAEEDSSQMGSKKDRRSPGQFDAGNKQEIKPSTSSGVNCSPSLTISSEKNKQSDGVQTKEVSTSDVSSILNKKISRVKDEGSSKWSGIGQKAFSSSHKSKADADSSKRESSGGSLNLKHGEKFRDQRKGNVASAGSQKEVPRRGGKLDLDTPGREDHFSHHSGNPKEDDNLADISAPDDRTNGQPIGPKAIVVLGLGKPSSVVHPNKTHSKMNMDTRSSVQKGVKRKDALSYDVSVVKAFKQLDTGKPTAHVRRYLDSEASSDTATGFDDREGKFPRGPKNDATSHIEMPSTRLPKKRRAVCIYEDDEDEQPRTPVHGGLARNFKVSVNVADNGKMNEALDRDSDVPRISSLGSGSSKDGLAMEPSSQQEVEAFSPLPIGAWEKRPKRQTPANAVGSSQGSEFGNSSLNGVKEILVSPQRSPGLLLVSKPIPEQQKSSKPQMKPSNDGKQKRASTGSHKDSNSLSDDLKPFQNRPASLKNRPESSLERSKGTPRTVSRSERLDIAVEDNTLPSSSSVLDSNLSMKHLIAAAQAKRRQSQAQNTSAGSLSFPALLGTGAQGMGGSPKINLTSPSAQVGLTGSQNQQNAEDLAEGRANSGSRHDGGSLSGGTEAAVARDAFEGMIETLSRTKESIGRATRHAIDCAKFGIANEVVELLIQKLENESSLHRKVDLFFLVDSITQCSHSQKGIAGASYIPIVQSALPRLLGAAAPPGAGARENRRQCLKVLRLWLERKILPEFVLRHYMDDIGVPNDDAASGSTLRRPSRAERAVDDPIREMEGMLVDEYGSNATFQLPGFLPSHIFEDDEEEEEHHGPPILPNRASSYATSPEDSAPISGEARAAADATPSDRRHCVLRDVDGELEMEDVSGNHKDERSFATHIIESEAQPSETDEIHVPVSANTDELPPLPDVSPPLPLDSPPPPPPLPPSPPPPLPLSPSPPPPPPPPPLSSEPLLPPPPPSGPPSFISPALVPPPHPLPSQSVVPPQSSFQSSPQLIYQQPVPCEYSGPLNVNQAVQMASQNPHRVLSDASVKSGLMHQTPAFVPAGVSTQEPSGFNPPRHSEFGFSGHHLISQASQTHQQYQQRNTPHTQRPPHIFPPQNMSNDYSFTKPPPPQHPSQNPYAHQYSYPPPSNRRQFNSEETWRISFHESTPDKQNGPWTNGARSSSTHAGARSQEGYYQPHFERPPAKSMSVYPSSMNNPPLPATVPVGHAGAQTMPSRPDVSSLNSWRPA